MATPCSGLPPRMARVALVALVAFAAWSSVADNRFPKPQFENGYQVPVVAEPAVRASVTAVADPVLLALCLGLAAWLGLGRRSRRGLYLLTLFSLLYFGFYRKGCVCSVGSVQNVAAWIGHPQVVLPLSVLAFFLLPLLFALFAGRVFCSSVCPLGAIQEMTVLYPQRVPPLVHEVLKQIPVVYLAAAVLLASTGAAFIICRFDPFIALFRLGGEVPLMVAGLVLLLLGVFVARPYCRYGCPYGVLLSLCSRVSKWHVTITPSDCVQCRLCEEACPFGAIHKPGGEAREPRETGVRRLKRLLLLLPVLVLLGGWCGGLLDGALGRLHPVLRLEQAVRTGAVSGDLQLEQEVEAFRSSGAAEDELARQASEVRRRLHIGGVLAGGFIGGYLGFCLIGLALRRRRPDYTIDAGACLSCGRCFSSCPQEHARNREASGTPGAEMREERAG